MFVLGFDWFLLFLSPNVHDVSAAHALRALCLTLLTFGGSSGPSGAPKLLSGPDFDSVEFLGPVAFRKDICVGGWMHGVGQRRGQMSRSGALPFGMLSALT